MGEDVIDTWRRAVQICLIDRAFLSNYTVDALQAGDALCAELERCRADLALYRQRATHVADLENIFDTIRVERNAAEAGLELCLAERDAWRAKFEDLEMHRASCCDQMEQERDAALRRVAELEAKGDRILFQHNAELRAQLARELTTNSKLRADFVSVCEDFDAIRDRLDAVEALIGQWESTAQNHDAGRAARECAREMRRALKSSEPA